MCDRTEERVFGVNADIYNAIKMLCLVYVLYILELRRHGTIKGQMNLLSVSADQAHN